MISSRQNAAVRSMRALLRDKRERDAGGLFAAEGDHLCAELVSSGCVITSVLMTERAAARYPETARVLTEAFPDAQVIAEELAAYISDTKAPQGLFASAKKPAPAKEFAQARRLVILDGVQDPGNVGTVLRTAEALGIDGALLSGACADIWSPKTMRASMGSVFRLPCITGDIAQMIRELTARGFGVYGAMLDESAQRLGEMKFPERAAVVIGNEGAGVSAQIKELCTGSVYIPISGAESLNAAAAAAILLWELSR